MNYQLRRALLALRDTVCQSFPLVLSTVAISFAFGACVDGAVTRSLIELYANGGPSYQDIQPEHYLIDFSSEEELAPGPPMVIPAPTFQTAIVIRIVDGDTIKVRLNALEERSVRFIGVDTPETKHPRKGVECFGPEATLFLEQLLHPGMQVVLGYEDKTSDAYGRLLAYVWLPWIQYEDASGDTTVRAMLLNARIIYEGYGRAYTKYPFRFSELFVEAERQAKEARRGLWSACPEA